ncbi:cytochrome P460 family protein [Bradyrhizobium sp. AS23.2]|uniref:cytochrome P460 family protein n=1 Tax=Bradyrhizobium sp. AS23.2 TaxID=1680155 RepID=UPI000ABB1924|nr:cytochrome P460 family protein [Bradyrhizobium sp. AS23.2]
MRAIGKLRPALRQLKSSANVIGSQHKEQRHEKRQCPGRRPGGIARDRRRRGLRANRCALSTAATAAVVDDKGNLRVPSDYQTAYQMLGFWAVAKDGGPGSKELHVVYASPGTIAAYRKHGHFPDGAVLVKEVFRTTTGGNVSSAGALAAGAS